MGATAETRKRLEASGPNVGNIDMAAPLPAADTVEFSSGPAESDCQVSLRVLGPYLLGQDNNNCGGLNVSFSGTYRQTSASVKESDWQDAKLP